MSDRKYKLKFDLLVPQRAEFSRHTGSSELGLLVLVQTFATHYMHWRRVLTQHAVETWFVDMNAQNASINIDLPEVAAAVVSVSLPSHVFKARC